MFQLQFIITNLPYPYPEEFERLKDKSWAEIKLLVVDELNKQAVVEIVNLQWHIKTLVEWFEENLNSLLNEEFTFENLVDSSVSEKIENFYDGLEDDLSEEEVEKMYNYRYRHGLRFGIRGTDAPDIYFGKAGNQYEISCCENGNRYKYNISNFPEFLDQICQVKP